MSQRNRIDRALAKGTAQTIRGTFRLNKAVLKKLRKQVKGCKTPEQLLRVLEKAQTVLNETSLGKFCTMGTNIALRLGDHVEDVVVHSGTSSSVVKSSPTQAVGLAGNGSVSTSTPAMTDPVRENFFYHH